jgi:hypothetical protein
MMAEKLSEKFMDSPNIVLTSSAKFHMNVAATYLREEVASVLKKCLKSPVTQMEIKRLTRAANDFSKMTKEERDNNMNAAVIRFEGNPRDYFGKILYIIDDSIITGAHQKKIENYIKSSDWNGVFCKVVFVYLMKYTPGQSGKLPKKPEEYINSFTVKEIDHVLSFVKECGFLYLNARALKFILKQIDCETIMKFETISCEFKAAMLEGIKGEGYDEAGSIYEQATQLLKEDFNSNCPGFKKP